MIVFSSIFFFFFLVHSWTLQFLILCIPSLPSVIHDQKLDSLSNNLFRKYCHCYSDVYLGIKIYQKEAWFLFDFLLSLKRSVNRLSSQENKQELSCEMSQKQVNILMFWKELTVKMFGSKKKQAPDPPKRKGASLANQVTVHSGSYDSWHLSIKNTQNMYLYIHFKLR